MTNRRQFLAGSTQLAVLAGFPGLALSEEAADARLVLVILRGGLDGLAAVVPYGESRYRGVRGDLAVDSPGQTNGLLKLDGLFGLHPSLGTMHEFYRAGELAVVHAVATPYRERSHFDGQNVLENGSDSPGALRDGWLNRAVGRADDDAGAIALSQNIPLVLRGDASVTSWAPSRLPETDDDTLARLAELYADDPHLAGRLQEALEARAIARQMGGRSRRPAGGQSQLGPVAMAAGRFLSAPDGPRIAVLEAGGWDTHANQGAGQGLLANRLGGLDAGLATLKRELGGYWQNTVVVIATEFGRTVAVNGTRGTDHGTGGCAFIAGGAVRGGRVIADWPGLAQRDLYEGRDLKPTTDLRAVFKGILTEHLGAEIAQLDRDVFPDSANIAPLEGLVETG
ncbi:MAG: DUF1501 domain-containing protein [Gammaproteobacteria bacterium]